MRKNKFCICRILIDALESVMPSRVLHVCIGSHAFAMFAHKKFLRVLVTLTTLYRTLRILLFGCLLSLCGHNMHVPTLSNTSRLCGAIRTIFSACCVVPSKKKRISKINNSWGFWEQLELQFLYRHAEWIETRHLNDGDFCF